MGFDGMNYVMNWIQQDNFNLLHNMQDASKFSNMLKSIVLQGKMNVPSHCLLCMQATGCMAEYFTTAGYFDKISTSVIEIV